MLLKLCGGEDRLEIFKTLQRDGQISPQTFKDKKEVAVVKRKSLVFCCCLLMSAALAGIAFAAEEESETQIAEDMSEREEDTGNNDRKAEEEALMASITGDYDCEEFDVECERDGMILSGILALPELEDDELAPVVILSHGFGSDKSEMEKLAKGFAVNGIASVRFDFIGSGESDGDSTDMSVLTEVDDLNAILDYVETLEEVDTSRIFLCGDSMGGLVSAITGAEREDEIVALLLNFPAFSIPDNMRDGTIMGIEFDVNDIPETIDMGFYVIGSRYVTDVLDMDPYELACGFSKDVLLFHGNADTIVDISYSDKAEELYPSVEYIVMDGAGHGFSGDQTLEQIEKSVDFVEEESAK